MPDAASPRQPGASPHPERVGPLGFYPPAAFRLTTGSDPDAALTPSARFYFEREWIAVPQNGISSANYTRGVPPLRDLRKWTRGAAIRSDPPPLVWIGSPERHDDARLSPDGRAINLAGISRALALVPKLPLNGSYFDAHSLEFLAPRRLIVRGQLSSDTFTARSFWPADFLLDRTGLAAPDEARWRHVQELREHMRRSAPAFAAQLLWERSPAARTPASRATIAIVVNGAQGDDDEAWAGHFAVCTGRLEADGHIDNLLVNNFYTLDSESEKGILAAPTPLDRYQADLNSGQSWYRPSWLLVATLASDRAAQLVQGAFDRMYQHFWRHQLVYHHATMNCTGISVDVLRTLGLPVAPRGPSSRMLAWLAIPRALVLQRSEERARVAYEYLMEDQTRLLPAAAFEECAVLLLALARGESLPRAQLGEWLAQDLESIALVDVPQIPSSRATGSPPVVTTEEYRRALPRDLSRMKIIPVPPRPFPTRLRDPDLIVQRARRSDVAFAVWCVLSIVGIPWLLWRTLRRPRPECQSPP